MSAPEPHPCRRRRPRRLGSSLADRRAGVPVVLHEMRPLRGTDAHKTDGLAELVCSNSFRSDDAETNAVGLLHQEMRRARFARSCATGDAHQVPAGGALAVDRDGFSAAVTAARTRTRSSRSSARRSPDCRRRTGRPSSLRPAPSPRPLSPRLFLRSPARRSSPSSTPSRRSSTANRSTCAVAWFQSRYDKAGPGGTGADYINCPLDREQYEAFIDALLAGDKTSFKEWEATPVFRRLPADRGHGGARPRDAAPRADEARRPHQPASAGREALRGRAAAPGQRARHAVQHGRLPDQAEIRRAGARLPHDPRTRECRVRAARRPAPQHLSQFAEAPRSDAAPQGDAAPALCRPDHRLRGLCRERRRSG